MVVTVAQALEEARAQAPQEPHQPDGFTPAAGTLVAVAGAISRGGPSRSFPIMTKLTAGQAYKVDGFTDRGQFVSESSRWYRTQTPAGPGWVHVSEGVLTP